MEEFAHCAVCERTPLIGEEVTMVGRGGRESVVCNLCLLKPRATVLGEALRRDRVKSAAGAASVHRIFPRPVDPGGTAVPQPAAAGFPR